MNTLGSKFKVSIFGESHGQSVGVVIDGIPAGMMLSEKDFLEDIDRRRPGRASGTSYRKEGDMPRIISGLFDGHTTGAPLAIVFNNENPRSEDYSYTLIHPRPSHADWVMQWKYGGFADYRGSGHFSGRLTLALVAAGVVARKIMCGCTISSKITEIGGENDPERFQSVINEAMKAGDSVGGIVECRADGVPAGLGEPFFDSTESVISHLLFSVPGVKGVEFGLGFGSARLRGSQNNDPIISADGTTATNNAGGIVGGITNSNSIVVRVAVKPTASISAPQMTLSNATGQMKELRITGRHDACIALRAAVVIEAAVAIALADLKMR